MMPDCARLDRRMIAAFAAVLLPFSGSAAHAQLQTGNLFGTVVSDQGEALPGATVTFSGSGAPAD